MSAENGKEEGLKILLYGAVGSWILLGAGAGAILSGVPKFIGICQESEERYSSETLERPIRFVYNTSRVAGSAGLGAFIGGATALTAPVSIPLYIYWSNARRKVEERKKRAVLERALGDKR